jgi:hypothetical protein
LVFAALFKQFEYRLAGLLSRTVVGAATVRGASQRSSECLKAAEKPVETG